MIISKPVFEENSLLSQVKSDDEKNGQHIYLQLKEREEEEEVKENQKKRFCIFSNSL